MNVCSPRLFVSLAAAILAAASLDAGVADSAIRRNLSGVEVVVLKTGVADVVTIVGTLPAGDARSPEHNAAIADLTGNMLDKGTTRRDKFAIAEVLGNAGATISFAVSTQALEISAKCLRRDVPLVIGLIAEQLRTPAFKPDEFAKLKTQTVGRIKRMLESTDFRAVDQFNRAIYPAGHVNRNPAPEELLAAAEKATLEDVKAFHAKYYGPAGMKLVVVGDVDAAAAQAELEKAFAGWSGGVPIVRGAKAGVIDGPRERTLAMPDKPNVSVVWGMPTGIRYNEADTLALRVGAAVLGSGFTGRLMATVRDREGLTYGIGSYVDNDTFADGDWRIVANFAPDLLDKGIASTRRELLGWHKEGITDAELSRVKGDLVGSYKVGLSTTTGMAAVILRTMNRDLPLTFIDEYGTRINALTKEQVNGAIRKYLDPEKMVMIKAGTVR